MKNLVKAIAVYIVLFTIGTMGFVLSFHIPLFDFIDVFFYRGVALILFWDILLSLVMIFLSRHTFKHTIDGKDIILFFVLFSCIHSVLFTHLPVTADRSISVFMLGHMADNESVSFSEVDVEEVFIQKYVKEYGAFEKRFHEQVETGTIKKIPNGEYQITDSGKKLMKLYDMIADLFGIDDKLIHPS